MRSTTAKTLVDAHCGLLFAKCPHWIDQNLLFIDVHDRCIKSADMEGTVQTVRNLDYLPGSFDALADGRLIIGDAWHRKLYLWGTAGRWQMVDLRSAARCCLSDGIVDGRGNLYVGDVGFNFLDPLVEPAANGAIIRVRADGESTVVARNLFFPNSMIISPDGDRLVVAESLGHRLTAFDIGNDGSLQNRQVWAQFPGSVRPEGICLDCDGAIWIAGTGLRALRVREGGEVDCQVTTRRPVVATALGGPERRHLFMCTSASHDPVITRQYSDATIDIAEVDTPGHSLPCL